MITEIKHLIRKRQQVYNRAKLYHREEDWTEYKFLQKQIDYMLKLQHKSYIANIISSSNDKKPFWRYIKSKRQDKVGINILKTTDGEVITNSLEKANILNQYFKSVFISEDCPDNIHPYSLKGTSMKISPMLAQNYCPISLTSVICKTMEHVIVSQLMKHLESNCILLDNQFGFRQHHSCESQLLVTIDDVTRAINNKLQVDAAMLDFAKAFDKVAHQRLLHKLEYYGIRGKLLKWLESFLNN